jgi:lauroyl/myristoyl acyltransferase
MYRPDGWNPSIRLEGGQHIAKAINGGNGAILWVAPSSFHRQVSKIAFMQAGYCVNHLSRYEHGFSSVSWFGQHCLNPIRTVQESRYLNQRVVIGRNGSRDALKRLEELLRQNKLVSITVGQARRTSHVDFLSGKLVLATGPAFLSHKTKAPLLPVFTVRESHETFTTRIEPPLHDNLSIDGDSYIEAAVTKYAAVFENYALQYPAQFLDGHGTISL